MTDEIDDINEWLVPESGVDRRVWRTVQFGINSATSLKCACIAAGPIVGTYSGATAQIAKELQRDPSTIENYAHAHWMTTELRRRGLYREARIIRATLPASHLWSAWAIHEAGYDAYHYLKNAVAHHWSGQRMMREFRADRDAGNAPMLIVRTKHALLGIVNELLTNKYNELSQEWIDWLMSAPEAE